MPLTNIAVRNTKPKTKPYKLADGEGMYLLVTPDGGRYWRMDYRFNGKRGTLAFGVYPEVSLAAARDKRASARKQLAAGIHAGQQRKLDKLAAVNRGANTFRGISEELLAKMTNEGRALVTLDKTRWLLEFAHPHIWGSADC